MKAQRRNDLVWFWCVPCETHHAINPNSWTWNGDTERPTFSPSVLVQGYQMSGEAYEMIERGEHPAPGEKYPGKATVCHSFVRDGRIEYLTDCTHDHAGRTVLLEDLP